MDQPIKRTVLDFDDIATMAPKLKGHRKLVERIIKWVALDKVNAVHDKYCDTPGVEFANSLLRDFDITLRVDGRDVLDKLPSEGSFITVSNHPFGALDGISLISLIGSLRADFKVMVNMTLNHISAMRPNFIAVDALASDDPARKAVSMKGIKEAIIHVKRGHPVGFFPAGAVSKLRANGHIVDRPWQPSVVRLIRRLEVEVVPVFFHGRNSAIFQLLGMIDWRLRTLRLPTEVWRKCGSTIHISVGEPIPVEKIKSFATDDAGIESLGNYLKAETYKLSNRR